MYRLCLSLTSKHSANCFFSSDGLTGKCLLTFTLIGSVLLEGSVVCWPVHRHFSCGGLQADSWINQISYELAHIVMFHTWLSAPFLETKSGDQSLKHFQMHSKSPQHSFLSTWAGVSLLFIVYLLLRLIKCWTLFLIWWMFLFLKQHFELKLWLHYF